MSQPIRQFHNFHIYERPIQISHIRGGDHGHRPHRVTGLEILARGNGSAGCLPARGNAVGFHRPIKARARDAGRSTPLATPVTPSANYYPQGAADNGASNGLPAPVLLNDAVVEKNGVLNFGELEFSGEVADSTPFGLGAPVDHKPNHPARWKSSIGYRNCRGGRKARPR